MKKVIVNQDLSFEEANKIAKQHGGNLMCWQWNEETQTTIVTIVGVK